MRLFDSVVVGWLYGYTVIRSDRSDRSIPIKTNNYSIQLNEQGNHGDHSGDHGDGLGGSSVSLGREGVGSLGT